MSFSDEYLWFGEDTQCNQAWYVGSKNECQEFEYQAWGQDYDGDAPDGVRHFFGPLSEIATLRARVAELEKCSTCGGDPHSHASGLLCVCEDGTRGGEAIGLRKRVAELERERDEAVQCARESAEIMRRARLRADEYQRERNKARAEAERMRGLLGLCSHACEHLHHVKDDQHGLAEPCPVKARIESAFAPEEESDEA